MCNGHDFVAINFHLNSLLLRSLSGRSYMPHIQRAVVATTLTATDKAEATHIWAAFNQRSDLFRILFFRCVRECFHQLPSKTHANTMVLITLKTFRVYVKFFFSFSRTMTFSTACYFCVRILIVCCWCVLTVWRCLLLLIFGYKFLRKIIMAVG